MSTTSLSKKKIDLKRELRAIEKQIYDLETAYLDETKYFGNIFSGWGSYTSEKNRQKKLISVEDRLFSLSSVTSPASINLASKKGREDIAVYKKLYDNQKNIETPRKKMKIENTLETP